MAGLAVRALTWEVRNLIVVLGSPTGFSLWLLANHSLSAPLSKSGGRGIRILVLFRLSSFSGETVSSNAHMQKLLHRDKIAHEAFRGKRANKDDKNPKYEAVSLVAKTKLSLM